MNARCGSVGQDDVKKHVKLACVPAASSVAKSRFERLDVTTRMIYGMLSGVWPIKRLGTTGSAYCLTT